MTEFFLMLLASFALGCGSGCLIGWFAGKADLHFDKWRKFVVCHHEYTPSVIICKRCEHVKAWLAGTSEKI